jgi:hypothetical protein
MQNQSNLTLLISSLTLLILLLILIMPVLIEHDRSQRAGVIDTFNASDAGLTVSGYLLDNDAGRAVA